MLLWNYGPWTTAATTGRIVSMKEFVVISAMGPDRVGIVDDITDAFVKQRCNVEESRMAMLGGEFAMILLVSGEPEDIVLLKERIDTTGAELSLAVTAKPTSSPHVQEGSRPYLIESVSLDTPGIVHAITSILRGYGINIEDLETDTTCAPWTGAPMFVLKARISVPVAVSAGKLREEIEALAEERDLDITVQPYTAGLL